MKHTTINLPDAMYRDLQRVRQVRGIEHFSGAVQEAVRLYLSYGELLAMERRISKSMERLNQRIERVAKANRAAFALQMALTREVLATVAPKALVEQSLARVLANAIADYSGRVDQFFEQGGLEADEPPPLPDDEPPPYIEEY